MFSRDICQTLIEVQQQKHHEDYSVSDKASFHVCVRFNSAQMSNRG
jgi:hypothetical protein